MDTLQENESILCNSSIEGFFAGSGCDSETNYLLFFVTSAIIIACGLVGNCSSFVLFSCPEFSRQTFAVYMRALAVSDSLVLLFSLGEDVEEKLFDDALTTIRILCPVRVFLTLFGQLLSSFLVVAVATDRYVAVVHPLRRASLCTHHRSLVLLGTIIMLTTAICLSFVVWNEVQSDALATNSTCVVEEDWSFFIAHNIIYFGLIIALPFAVVGVLNIRVFIQIKKSVKTHRNLSVTSTYQDDAAFKRTMSLILTTFVSVLVNTPLAVVELIELATNSDLADAFNATHLIHMLNYSLNFYIVVLHGRDYRRALWRACGCRPRVPRHDKSASSGSTSLTSISGAGK